MILSSRENIEQKPGNFELWGRTKECTHLACSQHPVGILLCFLGEIFRSIIYLRPYRVSSLPSLGDRRREEKASGLQCREGTRDQQEFEDHALLRLAVVTHGRPQRRLTWLGLCEERCSFPPAHRCGDWRLASRAGKIEWGCAVATVHTSSVRIRGVSHPGF